MTIRRFPRSRQSTLPYPATLDLSFLGRDTLDPRIAFTRTDATTCATRFNSSGILEIVAANTPRFDYDPATLAARGLLIEEARTNLALYSAKLDQFSSPAVWGLTGAGATLTATTDIAAPDGTLTAWTLTSSGATAQIQQAPAVVISTVYTGSFWIRRRSGTGTINIRVVENVNTPLTGVTSQWQRFNFTATSTSTTGRIGVFLSGLSDAVDIWGAQLEAGAFPTSYIPTSSAPVTRAVDAASIATLVPWYNASSGALFAEFSAPASGIRTMVDLNDTTATESIRLRTDGTNPFFTVTDGTDQANIDAGTVASNTVYKFAGAYAANDFATCINGGTVQTHTSGTLPTITQMLLGADAFGNTLNGHLRRLVFYPVRLSNTDLQAITA